MLLRRFVRFRSLQPTQNPTSDLGVNIIELCKIIKILKGALYVHGCNSNIIVKLGNFIKFYGKIPDILVLITGHFGLFKTPTLRLGEAGTTQTPSQTRRLNISKTDFKSVRKTINSIAMRIV